MCAMSVAAKIFLFFVMFFVALLTATAITGHDKRSYSVLNPEDFITIADRKMTVADVALMYKPRMFLRASTPSPALLWIWYEPVSNTSTIDITYYFVWENEIHPNPTLHKLYSMFRAFYYGYPLYDIEYFQINIRRDSGQVMKVRFETSLREDYFAVSEHIIAQYISQGNGKYTEIFTSRSGEELSRKDGFHIMFDDHHVLAGVQSWNHLTQLLTQDDSDFTLSQDAPLKYLTGKEYARYKFVRKSHGDHYTPENKLSLSIASVISFLVIYLPTALFVRLSKRR